MIKGAVFDMDGLMFDTERLVYESWQTMMTKSGYEYNLDIFKNTIGLRIDEAHKYYKSIYGEDFDYPPLRQKCRELFMKRIESEGVPIKKGLVQLLEYLRENNVKTAVATSTSAQTAHQIIKMAGVYDFFDDIICGTDVKYGKPHPEIFLTAAKRLELFPCDCVAFEDSINGIKSAYAAKMKTVMVPDYLQPTEEELPMISFLCSDLSEAVNYIAEL